MRRFQQYGSGPYKTGFERMIMDKLSWARLETLAGMGFVAWGLANLGVFGLSKFMHKENFDYHFAYTGSGKATQPLKSMMAAEDMMNVGWTAPVLIGGGFYLQKKLGSMTAMKLFGLSLFASYIVTCAFGPASFVSNLHTRAYQPVIVDSIDCDKKRMVGADTMALFVIYSCLFANGYFAAGAAISVLDIAYYGPMGGAMPSAAAVAAFTLL